MSYLEKRLTAHDVYGPLGSRDPRFDLGVGVEQDLRPICKRDFLQRTTARAMGAPTRPTQQVPHEKRHHRHCGQTCCQ